MKTSFITISIANRFICITTNLMSIVTIHKTNKHIFDFCKILITILSLINDYEQLDIVAALRNLIEVNIDFLIVQRTLTTYKVITTMMNAAVVTMTIINQVIVTSHMTVTQHQSSGIQIIVMATRYSTSFRTLLSSEQPSKESRLHNFSHGLTRISLPAKTHHHLVKTRRFLSEIDFLTFSQRNRRFLQIDSTICHTKPSCILLFTSDLII